MIQTTGPTTAALFAYMPTMLDNLNFDSLFLRWMVEPVNAQDSQYTN